MDSITPSRRVVRGILAGTLAVVAGIGLVACQTAAAEPAPEPVVYEDPLADQQRVEQSADRLRERYTGLPADRLEETIEREEALRPEGSVSRPADRIDDQLAREDSLRVESPPSRPADRLDEELARESG